MPSMKQKPMFNSVILLALSWVITILGIIIGVYLFSAKDPAMFLQGLPTIFSLFVVAVVVRMLANIGQLLFDTKIIAEDFSGRVSKDMARLLDANARLLYQFHELKELGEELKNSVKKTKER